MSGPFYGKYRGVVKDTNDPQRIGRLRAEVLDVTGKDWCGWAMPCVPFAGPGTGFFVVPPVDAGVWIEFEHGDPDTPIWSGGWWGSVGEMPPISGSPLTPQTVLLKTKGGNTVIIDDRPNGGIVLETSTGQKIVMSNEGIEIDNGQGATVVLQGSVVKINRDGLEVT